LSRGHVHYILTSPIYAGRIPHKGNIYEGQHPAIIDPALWQRVQERLQEKAPGLRKTAPRVTTPSPLLGKLFDETGERLSPSHSKKHGKRYRYYISRGYVTGRKDSLQGRGWRLPAKQLEQFVAQAIRDHLTRSGGRGLVANASIETHKRLRCLRDADPSEGLALLGTARFREGSMALSLDACALATTLKVEKSSINLDQLTFDVPFTQKRRGVETRLVWPGPATQVDEALVGNIARAHTWLVRVQDGESPDAIASSENTSNRRVQQTLEYAFLAPDIVRDILAGKQPLGLTSTWVATHTLPVDWADQRALIATL
jgi:site-specific DNA recombinase